MLICPQCNKKFEDDSLEYCPDDGSRLVNVRPSQAVRVDPLLGRRIKDTYKIVSRIGAGGMGTVYKAVQERLGRDVAVKVLPAAMAESEEAVMRFHREARAASSLAHPNTIIIHDYGQEEDGLLYIVMEYVEGTPLSKLIKAGGLTPKLVLHIVEQIAGSLTEAHERGMIHRDLKPDNIMLTRRAHDEYFVKVLDFGLAKAVGKEGEDQSVTTTGVVLGTPAYMSPEQVQGLPLGPACDQYALGVMVFEMVTGRPPFEGATSISVCMAHVNEPPPKLHEVHGSLPDNPGLETVISKALAKEPEGRFQSVAEFVEALRPYLGVDDWADVPVTAAPPGQEEGQGGATVAPKQSTGSEARGGGPAKLVIGMVAGLLVVGAAVAFLVVGRGGGGEQGAQAKESRVTPAAEPKARDEARSRKYEETMRLGKRYYKEKRYAAALEAFERAHGLDMDNPEPYQWIGETEKMRGNRSLARLNFEKYISLKEGELAPSVLEAKLANLLGPEPDNGGGDQGEAARATKPPKRTKRSNRARARKRGRSKRSTTIDTAFE